MVADLMITATDVNRDSGDSGDRSVQAELEGCGDGRQNRSK